jgi:hypothetical protein
MGGQGVGRNKLTEILCLVFPTIPLLADADKDVPAGLGLAKHLPIQLGNVAYPVPRDLLLVLDLDALADVLPRWLQSKPANCPPP